MPRVTLVKKARKDVPGSDIKAGESYYWWKFRFGPKVVSRTPPKREQLTRSDFTFAIYGFEDVLFGLDAAESLGSQIESVADDMESLADEQEDKLSNMPDGLQEGSVGQMLQERADALREWADELRNIDTETEPDETVEDLLEDAQSELGIEQDEDEEGNELPLTEDQLANIRAKAEEMVEEKREEKSQEIVDEAQGTSYGGP